MKSKRINVIKSTQILLLITLTVFLTSCDILQQATALHTFTKCKFRLKTVEDITLSGIRIQEKNSFSDLTFSDAAKVTQSLLNGTLSLSFTLNVEGKNPNEKTASLNKFEWILYIDDIEMTRGTTNQKVTIPANNGTCILPLSISVDLKKVLTKESTDALLNFGFNLAGAGNRPSRITVKAKPTILVMGKAIDYPGYINITNEFSSDANNNDGVGTIRL